MNKLIKIIKLVKEWLLEHILVEDKKYALYIAECENRVKEGGQK